MIMVTKALSDGSDLHATRMADHDMKPSGTHSDLPKAVIDLARDERAPSPRETSGTGADGELRLEDVVCDVDGEAVVFNDSGFRTLAIRTEAAVVAEGRVQKHVTAAGEDVSGFNYVTFEGGVTLYYPDGLALIMDREEEGPAR
jgi:hypothetical protein